MSYEYLINNNKNVFYPVSLDEIKEVEKELAVNIPEELKNFFINVGYGFIKGSKYNINRIMDPYSIRDFRLKQNDYEFFPDIDIYDDLIDELVFFEANETAMISIKISEKTKNEIYYDEFKIANSLEEFLEKISKDDKYYFDLIE
ncbi:SMI1/KNR4 family protein [Listeria welshimeri]|uniref:SMI1/KNR4 family protein n=1 Tax=Listeria welshimeri TaxID=1643 RepID=UPI001627B07D|nr:SMI1/KNR4 family protein [Listeria welshimeri]MBC1362569.1 SMI1/KNR4 family protein [Listeria welshimeri]MBC1370268.1 SMI1/KNR4 family protein [Listeria welshimeri]MBC1396774.1 SMI1/KNR4 family protein [Listeria welshimeri]MBC1466513.1 SMI1/KNR4 family protein [Listeria welshimeri]MBC1639984.1 SMI1/KNR4 family protein [Listeria welshimeri]